MFLLLAAVCSIVFNKIRLPPLIGYLIAGIIVANVIEITEDQMTVVEMLSNMGLILLMFCIGMEVNLKKLRKQGVFAMKVALIEIPFMVFGGTVIGMFLGMDSVQSLTLGAVVAGSSTAVVLGVLNMQNRLTKDEVGTLILVIIIEDISQVVILSMITPLLAGSELDTGGVLAMVVKILAFMIVSIFAGLKLMPRIVNWISDNVSPEILTVTAVGLAFGMALLSSFVGLSVAIGAFLMGMMIASSRKSKEILEEIEPMKNIFMAMFFISVGMEVMLATLMDNLGLTLILLFMFIILKCIAVFLGYWLGGEYPKRSFANAVSFLVMGEFAFIIAKQAYDYSSFSEGMYTAVVGAALLSMILLPIISKNATKGWDFVAKHTPDPIMGSLKHLDSVKTTFYFRVSQTSKRTRKEISSSMSLSYFLLIVILFIQIVFILLTPFIEDWASTYFGGSLTFWRIAILIVNLIVIFFPIYRLIDNLKSISRITRDSTSGLRIESDEYKLFISVRETNNFILALIACIIILTISPDNLGFWEHVVVVLIGLAFVFVYNRLVSYKGYETQDEDVATTYEVTLEEFQAQIAHKLSETVGTPTDKTTARIDTGDKRY